MPRKVIIVAVALVAIGWANGAKAITAEVAKACERLVKKNFPPRSAGNPAAGSDKGSFALQRQYFQTCVANGGKVDDEGAQPSATTGAPTVPNSAQKPSE